MTKDEFIEGYCRRSEITREAFDRDFVALPCNCEQDGCNGWAAIDNDEDSIKHHMEFSAPLQARLEWERERAMASALVKEGGQPIPLPSSFTVKVDSMPYISGELLREGNTSESLTPEAYRLAYRQGVGQFVLQGAFRRTQQWGNRFTFVEWRDLPTEMLP